MLKLIKFACSPADCIAKSDGKARGCQEYWQVWLNDQLKRTWRSIIATKRQCARVVKGFDSKSNGVTRAGSNPAVVVLFLPFPFCVFLITCSLHFFNVYRRPHTDDVHQFSNGTLQSLILLLSLFSLLR